jgi:hypothetical protein
MTVAIYGCVTLNPVPKEIDPEVAALEAEIAAALHARVVAEKVVDKRRDELAEKIVKAFRTRIAKVAEYTPEHVRRILRAHGIEGDASRLTPPQRLLQRRMLPEPIPTDRHVPGQLPTDRQD